MDSPLLQRSARSSHATHPEDTSDEELDEGFRTPKRRKTYSDDDAAYTPSQDINSPPQVSRKLFKRRKATSSLNTNTKENIKHAIVAAQGSPVTDGGVVCSISRLTSNMTVMNYAHVADRATPSDELDKIEWSWDRGYYTLNLDTRFNVFPVRASLHGWFDKTKDNIPQGWFWLPINKNILQDMQKEYVEKKARKDPDTIYPKDFTPEYRLVPFPAMKQSCSVKRYDGDLDSTSFDFPQLRNFEYPLSDLGPIALHIPYHFVILNTGKKLIDYLGTKLSLLQAIRISESLDEDELECLDLVREIYWSWMTCSPSPRWNQGFSDDERDGASGHGGSGGGNDVEESSDRDVDGVKGEGEGADEHGSGGASRRSAGNDGEGSPKEAATLALTVSLSPDDSASQRKPAEEADELVVPTVDDYYDAEWECGIKRWLQEVAFMTDNQVGSDSDLTLVNNLPSPPVSNLPMSSKFTQPVENMLSRVATACPTLTEGKGAYDRPEIQQKYNRPAKDHGTKSYIGL